MKKKILCAMLTALLVAVGVSAAEEESPVTYTPSAASVEPGGTFDVEVAFHGVEGALGYAVMLDNEVFENSVVSLSGEHPVESAETKAPLFAPAPDDANDVAAAYLTETTLDGVYVKYTFAVAADAVKGSEIALTFSAVVLDEENKNLLAEAGSVEVKIKIGAEDKLVIGDDSTLTQDEETGYIEGLAAQKTAADLIENFDNAEGTVRVVKADGTTEVTGTAYVGTGCKVQILVGETWTDAGTVIVKGDVSGDGKINAADLRMYKLYAFNKDLYPLEYEVAFDFNGNGALNAADLRIYKLYMFNPDLYPIN